MALILHIGSQKGENFWRDSQPACALPVKPNSYYEKPDHSLPAINRSCTRFAAPVHRVYPSDFTNPDLLHRRGVAECSRRHPSAGRRVTWCQYREGDGALFSLTSGVSNTANGFAALSNNSTGGFNTATGSLALNSNTTASNNTAVGYQALKSKTIGPFNTAVGESALASNTTGDRNTAIGDGAMIVSTERISEHSRGC